ncbi:MAG: 2-dehydropantoate 2-reductase [Castellaniella sp.]|nr:2-dehydropantoate 2-reductase [Castellaniella sp.]
MRICILGAGALGCAIGAGLAEGGADVTLLNRNTAHVDAINAEGLRLRDHGGERRVRIRAALSAAQVGPVDLVIVLVKSFHTREAMEQAGPLLAPRTLVLSLQNGLGHEDVLAEYVGRGRVLAGKTYVGGTLLGPGHIISGVRGKETVIGELDGRVTDRVRAVAREFERAGMLIEVSDNIMGTIWDKLLINVATGAVSAITRMPYGPLFEIGPLEAVGVAAVREAMEIAHACGVRLSITDPVEAWRKAGAGLPADFRASMLQSLDKGSVTEIDYINGAVVERGLGLGIAAPVNATLAACVKGLEAMLGKTAPACQPGVDHVAVRVADIGWHIRFFQEVLDMPVREVDGSREAPRQVWLQGGIQLIDTPGVAAEDARTRPWIAHVAIRVRDLETALARAADWAVTVLPQGPNWLRTPDGIALELLDC